MKEEKRKELQAQLKWNRKKVTNVVGTFLTWDSGGFQVPVTHAASEKVADMVGTFLPRNRKGFLVLTTKTEPEKVTNVWEPFCLKTSLV